MAHPGVAGKLNRLAASSSPYLRQHERNPVEWWPWCDAAFDEARRRNVPVFLSIGYSTCHWCHVMAHESFEDAATAQALNEAFVCIKVDREERPDVDETYMAACQLMTGSGGWPLTAILDHNRRPFFAGTYFPRESRHGRIGTGDLAREVAKAWRSKRTELEAQAEHIVQHLRGEPHGHEDAATPTSAQATHRTQDAASPGERPEVWDDAAKAFAARFDATNGGFGGAPKFPSPFQLLWLLRLWHRTERRDVLDMVERTLGAMARGGIHDHVGGGFHRYSTDAGWHLPHFEKMLYDQAMMALAYTEAFQATGDARWRAVACSTLDYVLSDLADPSGGYHCGEDADAEGEEGKYQVWSKNEIDAILGARSAAFCAAFGVRDSGNFHDEATGHAAPTNVLHLATPYIAPSPWTEELAKLKAARSRRVRPHRDDKVLSDWNGLVLAALALAARAFGRADYRDAAVRLGEFLARRLGADGRMHHAKGPQPSAPPAGTPSSHDRPHAFLDDQAFALWGWLELHAATQKASDLERATAVGRGLLLFRDDKGGWTTSARDGERMVAHKVEAYDGALPSGNGIAAWCLHRLHLLTAEPGFAAQADAAITRFEAQAMRHPAAFPALLAALDLARGPSQEVLITGDDALADAMVGLATAGFHPRRVVLRRGPGIDRLAPWTTSYPARTAAYVCSNRSCKAPAATLAALQAQLGT